MLSFSASDAFAASSEVSRPLKRQSFSTIRHVMVVPELHVAVVTFLAFQPIVAL